MDMFKHVQLDLSIQGPPTHGHVQMLTVQPGVGRHSTEVASGLKRVFGNNLIIFYDLNKENNKKKPRLSDLLFFKTEKTYMHENVGFLFELCELAVNDAAQDLIPLFFSVIRVEIETQSD